MNNEDAIGFQKLEERAADIENNKDIAHDSVFDQMLAEYFLQKRGDVRHGNKLINELEKQFQEMGYGEDHVSGIGGKEIARDQTLGQHYNNLTIDRHDNASLEPYNLPALLDLDLAVNRHFHKDIGGLSPELKALSKIDTTIPDFFEVNDPRKPVDLHVKEVLKMIIQEMFDKRNDLEKTMSRRELIAYDQVLTKYL